jgi:hypothetical protein
MGAGREMVSQAREMSSDETRSAGRQHMRGQEHTSLGQSFVLQSLQRSSSIGLHDLHIAPEQSSGKVMNDKER